MSLDGSGSMEQRWMIIYSDEDTSHSLVPEKDVICEPSVEVGDEVQFIYGSRSRSRPLEGTVKAIGVDALELQKLMKAMNKKEPKKDGSFHEERQRSAKLKCINKFNKPVSPKKSKKAPCKETEQQSSSAQPKTPLEQVLSGNSDDSSNEGSSLSDGNKITDKDDSDSSSQEELTAEQIKALLKVAKGKKCKDLKDLLNLSVNSKSVEQKGPSKVDPKPKAKKVDKQSIYSTDEDTENEEEGRAWTPFDKKDKSKEKTLIVSTKSASSSKVTQDGELENCYQDSISDKNASEKSASSMEDNVSKRSQSPHHDKKDKSKEKTLIVSTKSASSSKVIQGGELENCNQDSISEKNASEKSASSIKQMEDNVSKRSQSPHHESETEPLRKKVKRPRKVKYEKVTFDGKFYRFSAKDLGSRKLHKNYNVYVNENNLTEIKRNAKTLLTVARHLTEEVYSDEAILACTVSGRPSSARPGVPSRIRPALDPEGVNAIYNYITDRARTKKLPVPSSTEVKKAIGGILNETRYNAALHAEAEQKMGGSPS